MTKGLMVMVVAVMVALTAPIPYSLTSIVGFQKVQAAEAIDGMKRLNLILKKLRDHSTHEGTAFELGGLCKILDALNATVTVIIPMQRLPDTEQGVNAWVKLYEDEENGIAFYANASSDD